MNGMRAAVGAGLVGILIPIVTAQSQEQMSIWERANANTVRLSPSQFPALPATVREDLERRGCRIPQARVFTDVTTPHNVISGPFTTAGQTDWAVLCSIRDTSRILVYRGGAAGAPDSVARHADMTFQQGAGDLGIAFSRMLGSAPPEFIRRMYAAYANSGAPAPPAIMDHDGINDSFLGKASSVHYFDRNRWLRLAGVD